MNIVAPRRLIIDRTLGYPAKDIMTVESDLTCWSGTIRDCEEVIRAARESGYTFVPVRQNGRIIGIVRISDLSRSSKVPTLTHDWLITADTPILQLIGLLAGDPQRPYLVLQGSEVVGLVASADLNSTKSRASLYLLVAHFESELARIVGKQIGTEIDDFKGLLSAQRLSRLSAEQAQAKERDVNLSFIHYLYLTDLTTIVARSVSLRGIFGFTSRKQAEDQLSFTPIRNPLSHQNSPVVSNFADVRRLNESVERLIRLSQQLTEHRQGTERDVPNADAVLPSP